MPDKYSIPIPRIKPTRIRMISSIKRLGKHSIVYGLGHILTRSLGFLLLPLHTNYLAKGPFGLAALVFGFLALMTILYTYGVDAAFLRYYILSENRDEQKRMFSTAFITVFWSSLAFSLAIFLGAGWIAEILLGSRNEAQLIRLSSGILLFDAVAVMPFLVLRAKEQSIRFVSIKMFNILVAIVFNVVFLVVYRFSVDGIFWANLIASAATLLALIPVIAANFNFNYSGETLKRLLRFGLPYIPATLAVVIMDVIDRYILRIYSGEEVVGVYHAGHKLGMVMALIVAAFRFAWHPFFLATVKQENAQHVFSRVLTYFMLVCGLVYVGISFFVDDLVRLHIGQMTIFGEDYWAGTGIVPIIMLAYAFYGAYLNFLVGIYLEKKTGYLPFITGFGATVNIVGNILLIPIWGMYGAAWSTVLGYFAMAVALYATAIRLYPVKYEFVRLIKLALVLGLYTAIFYYTSFGPGLRLLLTAAFPVALLLVGFFKRTELKVIGNVLRARFSRAVVE